MLPDPLFGEQVAPNMNVPGPYTPYPICSAESKPNLRSSLRRAGRPHFPALSQVMPTAIAAHAPNSENNSCFNGSKGHPPH
eukprot:8295544-Prorocentrum_lima.AAC.1